MKVDSSTGYKISTLSIHSDSPNSKDVSVPMHVSTTYVYSEGYNDRKAMERGYIPKTQTEGEDPHIYSRDTIETRNRLEQVLGSFEDSFAVTYASGLAATFALFEYVQPKTIAISKEGYHGTHGSLQVYCRNRNVKTIWIEDDQLVQLKAGDLLFLESPQNPRGEVADIAYFKSKVANGVVIAVDSTFAPPPIQLYLTHGADFVMHSSTKFLGGHSDLLGGVLTTKRKSAADKLKEDRMFLGSVMGNFETWLLLRSLRTLTVRVLKQSDTAAFLARWMASKSEPCLDIVEKVWHASLPGHPGHEAAKRQGNGWSGVLSVEFKSLHHARLICRHLKLIINATSLGGVESLIEWRAAVDPKITPKLVRISIGLEDPEDLQNDFRQGFLKVAQLAQNLSKI